jgi:hypothetical protein
LRKAAQEEARRRKVRRVGAAVELLVGTSTRAFVHSRMHHILHQPHLDLFTSGLYVRKALREEWTKRWRW